MQTTRRDVHLNVRVSAAELKKLHEIAVADDVSVSTVIRHFIRERHAERVAHRRRARRRAKRRSPRATSA